VEKLHDQAMQLLDDAFAARRMGQRDEFLRLAALALESEVEAAELVANDVEPSRSVLFRSAAALAMLLDLPARAMALAGAGIAGRPPPLIRSELVSVIKDSSFRLLLAETEGVTIRPESLTMSLEGQSVGNGVVEKDIFTKKLDTVGKLIRRTADRMYGLAWQNTSAAGVALRQFVSAPMPGSFSVCVQLGTDDQGTLPGLSIADATLKELVECFEQLEEGGVQAVRNRIVDETYFQNFMGLARDLVPDGRSISSVKLSAELSNGRRAVNITRTRKAVHVLKPEALPPTIERTTVSGVLRYADAVAGKDQVKVITQSGVPQTIHVPAGLMDDIVRPYFGLPVVVVGTRVGGKQVIELEEISPGGGQQLSGESDE
jgi:hypothetical protein